MPCLKHIAVAIPLPYRKDGAFWERDAGLLVLAFQRLGFKATLVALSGKEIPPAEHARDDLILGNHSDLISAEWWQNLSPDAVVFFGWGLHHFEDIRQAFRQVTSKMAEHMDSDGMRSPLLGIRRFWYLAWAQSMNRWRALHSWNWRALPSAIWASIWTLYCMIVSSTRGAVAADVANRIPTLLLESPLALSLATSWLKSYGYPADNLHFCPHSIDLRHFPLPEKARKKPNRVVAIGRWTSFQKNFPAALRVARNFLKKRGDYEFHFVGETPGSLPSTDRLIFHGHINRTDLGPLMSDSNILFASSRYESFHLAAGEALCSGCSVVLPSCVPTAAWFASQNSGTIASQLTVCEMTKALLKEANMWDAGKRNAFAIATFWRNQLDPDAQARKLLCLLS